MRLIISEVLPKFTVYPTIRTELKDIHVPPYIDYPPSRVWYIADLIRLRTTRLTRSLFERKVVEGPLSDYRADAEKYR
jgi:hypothetical protein